MPALSIGTFRGMMPRVDPRLLPEQNGQKAVNCYFDHGNLEALNAPLSLSTTVKSNAKTLFLYQNQHWFSWPQEVHAVNSPIPQDPHQRVYFTGTDCPRYTKQDIAIGAQLPNSSIKLGIPKPTGMILADNPAREVADIVDATDDETRFYTFTWVSGVGEEGPPADPSNKVVLTEPETQHVTLHLPVITVNDRNITHRRIYRSATSGDVTEFFLVAELPVNTTNYVDKKLTEELSVLLASQNYFPPPEGMKGLTALPNGVLVGFDGNVVCPSEPNLPYAYDPNNQLACDWDVVAIGALPNGAVIATKGQPYLLQGFTPDSYQLIKLESSAPCVSSRSLVDMGSMVIYASPEGLVAVGNGEPELITRSLMTFEQWQAFQPETIHAYQYKDKYIAVSATKALMFDPAGPDLIEVDFDAATAYRIPESERLVMAKGGAMKDFNAGPTPLRFSWRSKEFKSKPTPMSAAKVVGDGVVMNLYRDGQLIFSSPGLSGEKVMRLPAGYGSSWSIELEGTGMVETVAIGNSIAELM